MTANVYADEADKLERSRPPRQSFCKWRPADLEEGTWDTNCGESHTFKADGPDENGFSFCPYCGDHLKEVWPDVVATNLGRSEEPPEFRYVDQDGDNDE